MYIIEELILILYTIRVTRVDFFRPFLGFIDGGKQLVLLWPRRDRFWTILDNQSAQCNNV